MSLNGLDDAKVTEAYQSALAEAGGWFLLKYASRDAIEVVTRGTGGAAEARGAVAQYEEKSPLYGFLLYRRRKVLIKFIPEGTSRLLQARVAVHFQAVTEKFTPHDTILSIASAEELSDSALISACSLHTAAPSSCSSSGSSRRHKLDEITEDAEEGQGAADETATQARPTTAASSIPTIVEPTGVERETKDKAPEKTTSEPPKVRSSFDGTTTQDAKSAVSEVTAKAETDKHELKAADYKESLKYYDSLFENGPDPRFSSQTARPAMSDLYAEIYAQYKPKVKLGPRPRPSLDVKRPHTSGTGAQNPSKPVSQLPAGLRVANRKTMEPKRPKSRDSSVVPSIAFPPPPPVPSIPDIPPSPTYPPKSPASVKSMPIPSHSHGHKSTGITLEKQRLMKAVELRKKQMKARKEKEKKRAQEAEEPGATAEEKAKDDDAVAKEEPSMIPVKEESSLVEKIEEESVPEEQKEGVPSEKEEKTPDDTRPPNAPEDSGVSMTGSHTETDDQHSAASACSPISAQTQGSSGAPSTRPSSISEDDRPLPNHEEKLEGLEGSVKGKPDKAGEPSHNEDEKESIESSPTVVPDPEYAVPSIEVPTQPNQYLDPEAQNDSHARRKKRESMVFMPSNDQDDARSQRRSKRESMVFLPSTNQTQSAESSSRRDKRESMILPPVKSNSQLEAKEKRRAPINPIHIHLSAENSDAEYLSDDSFMEELQSAKVEEAKPVSVSKSPISRFFPRKTSISEVSIPERSSSQQYQPGRLSPEQLGGRKSSGPWLPPHANTDTVVVAKKINVSSGISQRIKALAEKSNKEPSASVSSITTPDASNSIVAQRKSSFFSTPPNGNSPPHGQSVKRLSRASFASLSNSPTPDRKSVLQPPPSIEQTVYNVRREPEKPESVQVTARIVRDGRTQKPSLVMPNESTPLELHQSPIIIDHKKSIRPSSSSKSPSKLEPTSPRPPSSSHSRDASVSALPRSSSESSWRSFGRRLSESKPSSSAPRSQSTHSFESCDEKREEKKDKKDSRTSKLFKRMSSISSISSISRKNSAVSPVLQEEDYPSTSLPAVREPPPAVQVGDLNVQFPDTLLWKRRWVEIDGMGNLVLSLSKANEQSKGITKRFHLSEFQTPYAPDQDRQELPNSVILDFTDGRTLQCACETYVAQMQVLQILREAHDAWLAYGQLQ